MKVRWKTNAIQSRRQIARYINKNFGATALKDFLHEIDRTVNLIKSNPAIAHIDPLFDDRVSTYRSIIVNRLSKLVYRIDDDVVNIVAFWDCRKDPTNQAAQVK